MLRCTRGTFWKPIPGDLNRCFLTELTVPMQKMEGICLPCQTGKPDELRSSSFICIYCLTACTGQQGKQQSHWNNASTPGFWYPSTAGARGLFASLCSGAVSGLRCRLSQSCWNIMCPVSSFCTARLTLPCSLLRVRWFQSPWQPWQVIQVWSGRRSCPLTFSKRETCPASACNCSLRCWAKPLLSHVSWMFDTKDTQTDRDVIGIPWLSDQGPEHCQVSTGFSWDGRHVH